MSAQVSPASQTRTLSAPQAFNNAGHNRGASAVVVEVGAHVPNDHDHGRAANASEAATQEAANRCFQTNCCTDCNDSRVLKYVILSVCLTSTLAVVVGIWAAIKKYG